MQSWKGGGDGGGRDGTGEGLQGIEFIICLLFEETVH